MLTDKEIQKIIEAQKEVFSTKVDLESFKNKIVTVVATKEDVNELKKDVDGLRESVQALTISVDGLVNSKSGVDQEDTMIDGKVERHEKWINKVASKIGVPMEY